MQISPLPFERKFPRTILGFAFLPFLIFASGCTVGYTSRTHQYSEVTQGDLHRREASNDGIVHTMEHTGKVVIEQGRITYLSPGCIVHLTESRFGKKTVAEVREKDGAPELWMSAGLSFRPANAKDRAWLERFLWCVGSSDRDQASVESRIRARMAHPEDGDFLAPVGKLAHSSDRVAVLENVIRSPRLNSRQQVALIQACFEHLSFSSDRVPVLLQIVRRSDFSFAAKQALLERVDMMSFDSDKAPLLKALSAR
ncbi:MAG: hypothetical protein RLZZ399_2302 [Verrucomicrobiota bacterium]|jgi:hypothetical protein